MSHSKNSHYNNHTLFNVKKQPHHNNRESMCLPHKTQTSHMPLHMNYDPSYSSYVTGDATCCTDYRGYYDSRGTRVHYLSKPKWEDIGYVNASHKHHLQCWNECNTNECHLKCVLDKVVRGEK